MIFWDGSKSILSMSRPWVGTVLYCMQAIAQSGEEVNEKEVVSEFKGWKGRKYPEASIKETFSRIQGVLST